MIWQIVKGALDGSNIELLLAETFDSLDRWALIVESAFKTLRGEQVNSGFYCFQLKFLVS